MKNVTCLPIRYSTIMYLSNDTMPLCNTSEKGLWGQISKELINAIKICPTSCTTLEFVGNLNTLKGYVESNKYIWFDYFFLSEDIQVYKGTIHKPHKPKWGEEGQKFPRPKY